MKKLNKFVAILVALAMMAVLGVTAAFAEDPEYYTNEDLTITIETTKDQALPTLTDTINVTKGQEDAPDLALTKTTLAATDFGTATVNENKSVYTYTNETVVPAATAFPHAGEYVYTVTQTLTVTEPVNDGAEKVLNPDDASYEMHVYVVDNNGTLSIKAVTLYKNDTKLDLQKDEEGGQNGITFDNDYFEKLNNDEDFNDDDDKNNDEYIVEKQVADGMGDKTKQFEMTVDLAVTGLDGENVKAFIRGKDGTKDSNRPVTIENGQIVASIADDEQIIVKGLPIGATYTVDETDAAAVSGTETNKYTKAIDTATGTLTSKGTKSTVTNTFNEPSPEGILISNLPYIALALVAIGGLVAYVVVRRKADDEA